ncbi:MAG: metal-dependent transcriptional regulator [Lachnospiraceae bacterium]|nr:metal-dependent transcriptional regulator [Lachnospiraceae bacterium]
MNRSAEDYIKTIYILKKRTDCIHSVDVARELGFSKASVSLAMSNLRKKDIIIMKKDGEIEFTPAGKRIAEEIYDRYVMLSSFLQDVAGVDETTAKEDAWKIGYYISDLTYEGIKQFHKKIADQSLSCISE